MKQFFKKLITDYKEAQKRPDDWDNMDYYERKNYTRAVLCGCSFMYATYYIAIACNAVGNGTCCWCFERYSSDVSTEFLGTSSYAVYKRCGMNTFQAKVGNGTTFYVTKEVAAFHVDILYHVTCTIEESRERMCS